MISHLHPKASQDGNSRKKDQCMDSTHYGRERRPHPGNLDVSLQKASRSQQTGLLIGSS